jgi:hypothetical protein
MPDFSFSIPPTAVDRSVLHGMPPELGPVFRESLKALIALPESVRDGVLEVSTAAIADRELIDEAEIASNVGLDVANVKQLIPSLTLLSAMATSDTPLQKLLDEAVKLGILAQEDTEKVSEIYKRIAVKSEDLRRGLAISQLSKRILPSYKGLSFAIDERVAFTPRLSVPVAVCHLTTDLEDAHVHYQMTAANAKSLLKKMRNIVSRLEEAETLARKWLTNDGLR